MKNKSILRTVSYVLVIILYNMLFFLIGKGNHSVATWIAYGFTYVAFIISYIAPIYCHNYKRIPENLVTIYGFAWLYTAVGFVINLLFVILKIKSIKFVVIINFSMLVLYFIQLIINIRINYVVETNIETVEAEREYVREVSSKLNAYMKMIKEQSARKAIEKAYDDIRTSPIHSNDDAMQYEIEVIRLVGELEHEVDKENVQEIIRITTEISKKARKRNAVIKN